MEKTMPDNKVKNASPVEIGNLRVNFPDQNTDNINEPIIRTVANGKS